MKKRNKLYEYVFACQETHRQLVIEYEIMKSHLDKYFGLSDIKDDNVRREYQDNCFRHLRACSEKVLKISEIIKAPLDYVTQLESRGYADYVMSGEKVVRKRKRKVSKKSGGR